MTRPSFYRLGALVVFAVWLAASNVALAHADAPPAQTVVLAATADPFLPLAEEIARAEGLTLVHHIEDALAREPTFLLWVVSPAKLSDRAIIAFALALRDARATVSVGIIAGTTQEQARALWQRAQLVHGARVFAVNAQYPTAGVEQGRIRAFDTDGATDQPLTHGALIAALQNADYLTFTGHGGNSFLRLDETTRFESADVPALPPLVIATASCSTFRLWNANSLALAFAERGAAAYVGFAYSPNEGFLLGEFSGLPFRYTWRDFPIGHVVAIQNLGARRGFAQFPYLFLLGDPRLALQTTPPYRLTDDRQEGDARVLTFAGAPAGIMPIRVPGGAAYDFVEVAGIGAAGDGDWFYNSRVQAANIGGDKFVLVAHPGGEVTLRLQRAAPVLWYALDALRDAMDTALFWLVQDGVLLLAGGILVGLMVAWRLWREPATRAYLPMAAVIGLGFALLCALYAHLHLADVAITEKPVGLNAGSRVGIGALIGGAAFLYLTAHSRRGRIIALGVAALPLVIGAVFLIGAVLFINVYAARETGSGIYNYALAQISFIAAAFQTILLAGGFELTRRWRARKHWRGKRRCG